MGLGLGEAGHLSKRGRGTWLETYKSIWYPSYEHQLHVKVGRKKDLMVIAESNKWAVSIRYLLLGSLISAARVNS